MSISQAHRGRSNAFAHRLGRGRRRRLSFEVMEGRCLLSAVTLQFSPLSLPGTHDTTQVSLTTVIGGQQAASSTIVEGGYINLGGLQSQSINYVLPVVSGVGGAGVGSVGVGGLTLSDILGSDSYTVPFGDSTTSPVTQFDSSGGGFGMRPVVISPSIDDSVGTLRVNPGRSLVTNQVRGGQEGGIVQIEKILDGDERFDSNQFAVTIRVEDTPDESPVPSDATSLSRLLALPTDSHARKPALASAASTELTVSLDQPDERASDLVAPAKNSVITGELARAMVFELAGGEPAWIRPVVTGDQIKSVAPSDGQQAPRADAPSLSPAAAHQAVYRASGGRIRLNGNLVEFPLPPADSMVWSGAADLRGISQPADAATATVRGGVTAFSVPNIAAAEVFAELGSNDQPPLRSSFEDDAQTGPLVAGTVIALLILERAAARYKSRSERELLTVVAGPPRI